MLTQKVNLTQLCTLKEIQYILLNSEEYKGNLIIRDSYYQKQIIKYVLSNLNHRYLTIDNLTEIPKNSNDILPKCPISEKIMIRQLIEIKISQIVRQLLEKAEIKASRKKVGELK